VSPITKSFQFGKDKVTLETGEIARQASSAVKIEMGGVVVLVTAVCVKVAVPGRDFFPLTINYQEKRYSTGTIPGGFFKREGRPSEKETLTSRLIDRPLRPLFPKSFINEVQVVCTVLSADHDTDPDIASMIGASAALATAGVPFAGPIGAARVGYKDGQYLLNPGYAELKTSALDLVVAATDQAVLMVESEAKVLSEEVMLGAVLYGHEQMQVVVSAIKEFAAAVNKASMSWVPAEVNGDLKNKVKELCESQIIEAYKIAEKMARQDRLAQIRAEVTKALSSAEGSAFTSIDVMEYVGKLEKSIVRGRILSGERRIDGRDTRSVRELTMRTGVLPRTHGSALFTRGETQALVVTTLGTTRDAQTIDALEGERKDGFMLHYNFPPYSVGETGMIGSPKRREIGHGRLARRGVQAVMPTMEEYPYVVRVVSEIMESNGSSSMASVCGASLALMDAGVPIKAPVAGIAMGLIKEGDRFAVLTDILGDEDHLGDMDFKVAGTEKGITALQMDIKITGITREIMEVALSQAQEGRLHILKAMNEVISTAREQMSDYAPRILTMTIDPEKIRDVIGKGGATIRGITEKTGATIDINDKGIVQIFSVDRKAGEEARNAIELITAEVEVGKVYDGKVVKLMDFGAFVTILPGKDGLVHISQISDERVESVSDKLSEGDEIKVKVLEVDKQGRIRLSMKAVGEN